MPKVYGYRFSVRLYDDERDMLSSLTEADFRNEEEELRWLIHEEVERRRAAKTIENPIAKTIVAAPETTSPNFSSLERLVYELNAQVTEMYNRIDVMKRTAQVDGDSLDKVRALMIDLRRRMSLIEKGQKAVKEENQPE